MTRPLGSSGGTVLVVLAAIAGAAGVVLAALAAHNAQSAGMVAAANILMIHAVAVIAVAAWARTMARPRFTVVAAWGLLAGAVIFSAAVALPALGVMAPIPRAAPTGGTILIVAWLALAIAAGLAKLRGER